MITLQGAPMRKIQLESKRLIIKTISPSQAPKVLDFYIENKEFFEPYEPLREVYFYTKQHQRQLLRWDQQGLAESSTVRFWLYIKEDLSKPIGSISLSNIVRGVFKSCHLGYKIDHKYLRQGYMEEALIQVIEYAFLTLSLHRIEANIMPHNKPSLSLVKKLGFHEEGLAIKYLKIRGQWEDHIHMVLLNET